MSAYQPLDQCFLICAINAYSATNQPLHNRVYRWVRNYPEGLGQLLLFTWHHCLLWVGWAQAGTEPMPQECVKGGHG